MEVPGGISLLALHEILNEAMGWLDGHLHAFEIDGVEYTAPDTDFATELGAEDDSRWRLDAVVTEPGARFRYRYDFGDGWEHEVADWLGPDIDPEAFSIAETNAVLAERFADLKPLRRRACRGRSGCGPI